MALNLTGSDTPLLLLLSGPVAVGKSAIAGELVQAHGFQSIRTGAYLARLAKQQGKDSSRTALQELGDELDNQTDYRWLVDDVAVLALQVDPKQSRWLLDCVRKRRQVEHFRTRYGSSIFHIHLIAAELLLQARYQHRLSAGIEYTGNTSYQAAIAHPNEISARGLNEIADAIVDVSQSLPQQTAEEILKQWTDRRQHAASRAD
jgi:hypothetical protein